MQIVWILLAAGLMLIWLVLVVFGQRRVETQKIVVLRYGAFWRTLALVVAILTLMIMVYVIWVFDWISPTRMNLAGLCLLAVSIGPGLLLLEVTRTQVVLSDEGLTRYSPWSETVSLKWIEVQRVGYSALNRWFTVEGGGRTIRVSRHLAGIAAFPELLRKHVVAERCTGAAAALDAVK